jgi:hypothetical protein
MTGSPQVAAEQRNCCLAPMSARSAIHDGSNTSTPLMHKSNVGHKKCRGTLHEEILQPALTRQCPQGHFTTAAYNDESHAIDDEDQFARVSFQVNTRLGRKREWRLTGREEIGRKRPQELRVTECNQQLRGGPLSRSMITSTSMPSQKRNSAVAGGNVSERTSETDIHPTQQKSQPTSGRYVSRGRVLVARCPVGVRSRTC